MNPHTIKEEEYQDYIIRLTEWTVPYKTWEVIVYEKIHNNLASPRKGYFDSSNLIFNEKEAFEKFEEMKTKLMVKKL